MPCAGSDRVYSVFMLLSIILNHWVNLRVRHHDDDMGGKVVNVTNDGFLRVCWDDNSVSIHDTSQLMVA